MYIISTGVPGKIQCSQATAEALTRSGKEHWLKEREDLVSAKGKGIMRTFFLTPFVDRAFSANSQDTEEEEDVLTIDFAGRLANKLLKREREVEWVSELIRDSVREIVAQRTTRKGKIQKTLDALPTSHQHYHRAKNRVPLDEVVDIIHMPSFDSKAADAEAYAVKIPDNVSRLIREYVSIVSFTSSCDSLRKCNLVQSQLRLPSFSLRHNRSRQPTGRTHSITLSTLVRLKLHHLNI